MPTVVFVYAAVAIFGHIFLTRLRPGWHVIAIGGSRRSAYNTGIAVRRTVALCYVASGVLTALGGIFFASRLATAGGDIGVSLEITVLTAAVLGGISLGGGKGSVMKALVGTLIVLLIINGLTTLSLHGGYNRMVLAGDPAARRGDRHPLAEEPAPHRQQGLRQPDLPRACRRCPRPRPTAAPPGR